MNSFEKLKNLRHRFSTEIEDYIRENAIYSQDDFVETDLTDLLSDYELKLIGLGLHGRVYRVVGTKWVIKEGRWDLSMEVIKNVKLPIPRKLLEIVLKPFDFLLLPSKKEILKQYKEYLMFSQYFGYFSSDKVYYHPNRELIYQTQKNTRDSLILFKPELEKKYKIQFHKNLDEILSSKTKYHNFLPKEYLLAAPSISKENKGKVTSFIFQEFVKGKMLRDTKDSELNKKHKKQLVLLCYLILLMHYQVNWIPDTRPRYPLFEAYNWLTRTDNIISSKDKLIFIDTRWFWDSKNNLIKRGVIIPSLVIKRTKKTIQALLKELE